MQYIICGPGIPLDHELTHPDEPRMIYINPLAPPGFLYLYESREDWLDSADDLDRSIEVFLKEDDSA